MSGIDLDLEKKLREIDAKAWQTEKTLLLSRLEEVSSPPWYEKPFFVATVSVLLTAAATYGMFEIATHATK
jgi:hypothetical protein